MQTKKQQNVKRAAVIASIILVLWFASSLIIAPSRDSGDADKNAKKDALTPILLVQVMEAEQHRRYITINGETEASKVVGLMAETSGKITSIPAKEGARIQKGEVILTIDERDRGAQLLRAQAVLKQREIQYGAARKLQKQGFQSEVRLAETRANLEVARADLKAIQQDLSFTKLRAPFDGVLDAVNVEVGDFVFAGAPGNVPNAPVRMVALDPMIVKGFVSENDRSVANVGDMAKVRLNNGTTAEGEISYLASVSEAESRSFRIEITVPNANGAIASGVTAALRIPGKEYAAYMVPSSVLSLNDEGVIGVKHLDDNDMVQFQAITLIEETNDGVWVAGLPEQVRLIVGGQIYVSPGQIVKPELYRMKSAQAEALAGTTSTEGAKTQVDSQ